LFSLLHARIPNVMLKMCAHFLDDASNVPARFDKSAMISKVAF
jgi:hypothetical protein